MMLMSVGAAEKSLVLTLLKLILCLENVFNRFILISYFFGGEGGGGGGTNIIR